MSIFAPGAYGCLFCYLPPCTLLGLLQDYFFAHLAPITLNNAIVSNLHF